MIHHCLTWISCEQLSLDNLTNYHNKIMLLSAKQKKASCPFKFFIRERTVILLLLTAIVYKFTDVEHLKLASKGTCLELKS
jgi:hypothetical protein